MICSTPNCCELLSMRSSKSVCTHCVSAVVSWPWSSSSVDERGLVRQQRERGVLVGDARSRAASAGRRPACGGGGCCIMSTSFGAMSSTMCRRASSVSTDRAPCTLPCGRVVPEREVLEADALAVARPHVDEGQRRLVAQRPGVLVVRHDGVELLGPALGRLPPVDVGLAHGAAGRPDAERDNSAASGQRAPAPSLSVFRIAGRCYDGRAARAELFREVDPPRGAPS